MWGVYDVNLIRMKVTSVPLNVRTPKHHLFSIWDKWKIKFLGVSVLKHFGCFSDIYSFSHKRRQEFVLKCLNTFGVFMICTHSATKEYRNLF